MCTGFWTKHFLANRRQRFVLVPFVGDGELSSHAPAYMLWSPPWLCTYLSNTFSALYKRPDIQAHPVYPQMLDSLPTTISHKQI